VLSEASEATAEHVIVADCCVRIFGWALDVLWSYEGAGSDLVTRRTLQFATICLKLCDAQKKRINHSDQASRQLCLWLRSSPEGDQKAAWSYFDFMMERVPMRNPSETSLAEQIVAFAKLSPTVSNENDDVALLRGAEYCSRKWTGWLIPTRSIPEPCATKKLISRLHAVWSSVAQAVRKDGSSEESLLGSAVRRCSDAGDGGRNRMQLVAALLSFAPNHVALGMALAKYLPDDVGTESVCAFLDDVLCLAEAAVDGPVADGAQVLSLTVCLRALAVAVDLQRRRKNESMVVRLGAIMARCSDETEQLLTKGVDGNAADIRLLFDALVACRTPLDNLRRSDTFQALLSRSSAKPNEELCRSAYYAMRTFANGT
jgi:hypothetical protein